MPKIPTDVTLLREEKFMSVLKVRKAIRILVEKGYISILNVQKVDMLPIEKWKFYIEGTKR